MPGKDPAFAFLAPGIVWSSGFGWVPTIFGIQATRPIHHLQMWATIALMFRRVYSALLVDQEELDGPMASMFSSGSRFVTRKEVQDASDGGWETRGSPSEWPR